MKTLQIKKILVPTDFSKTGLLAIQHAAFMAGIIKADLYLLHAIEILGTAISTYNSALVIDRRQVETIAKDKLNKLAEKLKKEHGIIVKTICTKGNPAEEIATVVKKIKVDLVIMGTHGAKGFNEFFIGSNAHKTISQCSCPVITVRIETKKLAFTNIVLPIDDRFDSRQKVDFTIMLAKIYSATIFVLGVLDKKSDTNTETFKIKLDSVEKVIKKNNLSYTITVVKNDNLTEATLKYAKKINADLISVLTDQESKLTGMFLGAFAKRIVNHSKIPILSIRPAKLGVNPNPSFAGLNH